MITSREGMIVLITVVCVLAVVVMVAVAWSIIKKKRMVDSWRQETKKTQNGEEAAQKHLKELRAKPGDILFFRAPDNSKHPDVLLVVCETPGEDAHLVSDGVVSRIWYSRFFAHSHLSHMRVIRRDNTDTKNQQELINCCLMLAEQIKRNAHDVFGSPLAQESAYWESR